MNLSNACAHVRTPYGASGASASGAARGGPSATFAERAHDDHADAMVGRRRKKLTIWRGGRARCTGSGSDRRRGTGRARAGRGTPRDW
jgi:hypothetical protein